MLQLTHFLLYELHILYSSLHLANDIILHLTDMIVQLLGHPVVIELVWTTKVEYLVGIVAVHLGILLRKLRLVSVGGHKVFKWMSDNGKH